MAKYFIDTAFIERFTKPLFGKSRHVIDLISIGIVSDTGKEYYAISNEFNPNKANDWVKENVISQLPAKHADFHDSPRQKRESLLWKRKNQIAYEVKNFFGCVFEDPTWYTYSDSNIEVYGYFTDYDWVVLCSLFGTMMDLPKGFPMFCIDLKQMMEERGLTEAWKEENCPDPQGVHDALVDAKWNKSLYDRIITYPIVNQHSLEKL